LLRDADGDGVPEMKTVLLDHLHSPYGVAWVADTLYVANTDAIIAFPFRPGAVPHSGSTSIVAAIHALTCARNSLSTKNWRTLSSLGFSATAVTAATGNFNMWPTTTIAA
jgi:hypothetical protein